MVVAVGFMLVEPVGDADVNVPGVMAMLVAPAADQLRVLLAPEFMLVGFAIKEPIVGTEFFPEGEVVAPQPASAMQVDKMRSMAHRSGSEGWRPELRLYLQRELVESMRNPKADSVYCLRRCNSSSQWS